MITDHVQEIVTEAETAATALLDPIEGANDDLSLNIQEGTRAVVQGRLDGLLRRKALIKKVMQSARQLITDIEALIADGYPIVEVQEVSAAVYQDLDDQRRTQAAFFALVKPPLVTDKVSAMVSEKRRTTALP